MSNDIEADVEEIEIEEFTKGNGGKERPPKAKRYVIRVDKEKYRVTVSSMTGREILKLAGKDPPHQYKLRQKMHDGAVRKIGLDERVDFTEPGVERFMTLKVDQTEGEVRREFQLPSFDTTYLATTGLAWETLLDGQTHWLLIHDHRTPTGYNVDRVLVALQIPPGYPESQIDMAYFYPALARKDGKPINATQHMQSIDGKSFQRWSRHRVPASPWRPGEDDVSSHLALVEGWIEQALG